MAESAHLSLRNGLLLVVESRELGPEDGNCLYPLKGIVLNAQDYSSEGSMSSIMSRVRF